MSAEDPVVAELDVVYHADLNGRVYLLQYPMRPWHRGPEDPVSVDARPGRCMLEMEVAIPTDGPHFDARAASDPTCARMRHKATEVPLKAIHAVGVVQGNEVHLTPIHSVQQFRPDMSYLDDVAANADDSRSNVAQAVRIQTQFRRADEKASAARRHSYAYLKQYQDDEPWVRLRPHAISSDRATDVLNLLAGYASDAERLRGLMSDRTAGGLTREQRAIVDEVKAQARRLAEKRTHRNPKARKAIEELATMMGGQVRGSDRAAELAKFVAAAKAGETDAAGLFPQTTEELAREMVELFKSSRRNTIDGETEEDAAAASSSSRGGAATVSGGSVASASTGAGQRRARSATDSGSTLSGGLRIPPSLYVRVATGEPLALGPTGRPLPLQGLAGGSLAARRKAVAAAAATAAAAAAAASAASSAGGAAMLSAVAAPVTSNVPPTVAVPGHSGVHAPGHGPIIPTGVPIGTILSYPGDHANTYKSASKPKPVGSGVSNMAHPLPLQDMADFPVALQVEEVLRRAGPITFRQLLAAIKVPASPLDVLALALRAARLVRGCFVIKSELALSVHWSARLGPTVVATARQIGCALPDTVSATVEVVNASGCPALGTILSASAAALAAVQPAPSAAAAAEGGARVSLAAQSQAAAMAKQAANQTASLLQTRAGGRHPRALAEDTERRMVAVRDLVLCSFAQTPIVRAADLAARTGASPRLLTAMLSPLAECVEHRHGGLWRFKQPDQPAFCEQFPLLAASAEAWVAQRTEELAILEPPRMEPPLPEYVAAGSAEASDAAGLAATGPADQGRRYVWAPTDARPTGAPTVFALPPEAAGTWEARLVAESNALPEDNKLAVEMLRELMVRTDGGKLKRMAGAGGGGGAMKPDLGAGELGEAAGGGSRSVSFGAVSTHNLSSAALQQLPRTELGARVRTGLDTRLVKSLRDVVWKIVKDNGVVSRKALASHLIGIAETSALREVAVHVRNTVAPGAALPANGDATAIDRAAFARHPMLPRALVELAEHVSYDQLSYVPDGLNSRLILASAGQSMDRYRNIVVRLLANASSSSAAAMTVGVKKKDIHDAVKQSTGEDLTPNAYQKITSELATSTNQVWILKDGDEAVHAAFVPASLGAGGMAATM